MTLKSQIEQAKGNPEILERLYRQAVATGEESIFREAIAEFAREYPEDMLFSAWVYRLDIQPVQIPLSMEDRIAENGSRQWWIAVGVSIVLGALYIVLAGDKPPIPIPGQANPLFWIGWGPLTVLAILFYLAVIDNREERIRWYGVSAPIVVATALFATWIAWGRTDHIANLIAIHLPFVAWAAVGGSVALGYPHTSRQFFAFMVKSVETILTAGIYLAAGLIFSGLTSGIFAALGIRFSELLIRTAAAWGIGVIPILALASVYDPKVPLLEQNWTTGLARILRILTRLLLPLALGVLAIYVF